MLRARRLSSQYGGWHAPLLFALTVLAGCTIGPHYRRPHVAIPAAFKEVPANWKIAQPADQADRGNWWEMFGDADLNALEARLGRSNQTVAQFVAQYQRARALMDVARASYFPTLDLSASALRASSFSRADDVTGNSGGLHRQSNSYSLTLDTSWELDLWGKGRRQAAAGWADVQGAAANLANARLLAQATLAQNYFLLRQLDATQQLLDDTVNVSRQLLKLAQNQYAAGVTARSDVLQAQTQLDNARSAAVANGIARAQYEHAVAVLVGEPASTFSIAPAPFVTAPSPVPPGVPSALLERRPDIAAAERAAAAANEQVGVALAAFFPRLILSASGGFASSSFAQWLTAPARVWSLGPSLAATLFDSGLRRAQVEAARAAYEQQAANYRQTVLAAFQEVEDQLASVRILERQQQIDERAVKSAWAALQIITHQYQAGTQPYLQVLVAQTTAFSAQQRLVNVKGQRIIAMVGLVKALGGGWSSADLDRLTKGGEKASLRKREPDVEKR